MKKLRAISIFVLCFALLFSSTITASAAQSAKAATLRLEKTQGSVTVTNASGTSKKATQNMKLLSGYTVSTGKASYAYISLDNSKALKLDASSKVSIHKAGKKLEVKVVSGKVMFNVSAPLTSQESLTIRTSTMVTGVRGTAGWFESDQRSSAVYLLEGSLDVYSTGRSTPTNITSGQQMTSQVAAAPDAPDSPGTPDGSGTTGETEVPAEVKVENFTTAEVPGFVATEVAENPELQKRMEDAGSPIDPNAVTDGADEKLKQDENNADKQEQQLKQQEQQSTSDAQQNQNSNDTLFDNNSSEPEYVPTPEIGTGSGGSDSGSDDSGSGSGGSDSGSDGSGSDSEPEPLTDPTQAELTAAFETADSVSVVFTNTEETTGYFTEYLYLDVPANKELNLVSGTLVMTAVIDSADTVFPENPGKANLNIYGTLNIAEGASLLTESDGTIYIYQGGALNNDGTLQTIGNAYTEDETTEGKLPEITNCGTLFNKGTLLLCNAELTNEEGSQFTNGETGTVRVGFEGEVVDNISYPSYGGKLNFNAAAVDENASPSMNFGTISVYGNNEINDSAITIASGATLNNIKNLDLIGYGTGNCGQLIIYGELVNSGKLVNNEASIENYGSLVNNGTWENTGTFHAVTVTENVEINGTYTDEVISSSITTIAGPVNNNITDYGSGGISIDEHSVVSLTNTAEINNYSTITVDGELIITSDCSLTNLGTLNNYGTLKSEGTINNNIKKLEDGSASIGEIQNYGTFENSGTFTSSGSFTNMHLFLNSGLFTSAAAGTIDDYTICIRSDGCIYNFKGGIIEITKGEFIANREILLEEYSYSLTNEGTITVNSNCEFIIGFGCTLNNLGTLTVNGTLTNHGELLNNWVGDSVDRGTITINNGTLNNTKTSTFGNNDGCTITVGENSSGGQLIFGGTEVTDTPNAYNNGTITINSGNTMTIVNGCTLINNGKIENDGKIENNGKISGEGLIIPPSEGDDGSTSEGGDSTTTEGSDGSAT